MPRILTAILTIVFCSGCMTTLSPDANKIRVVEKADVAGMEFLGNVVGTSSLTGVARDTGFENARNEMLEKAAKLKATHVVISPESEASYFTTSEVCRGEAYRK